jgi:hypothetical protein
MNVSRDDMDDHIIDESMLFEEEKEIRGVIRRTEGIAVRKPRKKRCTEDTRATRVDDSVMDDIYVDTFRVSTSRNGGEMNRNEIVKRIFAGDNILTPLCQPESRSSIVTRIKKKERHLPKCQERRRRRRRRRTQSENRCEPRSLCTFDIHTKVLRCRGIAKTVAELRSVFSSRRPNTIIPAPSPAAVVTLEHIQICRDIWIPANTRGLYYRRIRRWGSKDGWTFSKRGRMSDNVYNILRKTIQHTTEEEDGINLRLLPEYRIVVYSKTFKSFCSGDISSYIATEGERLGPNPIPTITSYFENDVCIRAAEYHLLLREYAGEWIRLECTLPLNTTDENNLLNDDPITYLNELAKIAPPFKYSNPIEEKRKKKKKKQMMIASRPDGNLFDYITREMIAEYQEILYHHLDKSRSGCHITLHLSPSRISSNGYNFERADINHWCHFGEYHLQILKDDHLGRLIASQLSRTSSSSSSERSHTTTTTTTLATSIIFIYLEIILPPHIKHYTLSTLINRKSLVRSSQMKAIIPSLLTSNPEYLRLYRFLYRRIGLKPFLDTIRINGFNLNPFLLALDILDSESSVTPKSDRNKWGNHTKIRQSSHVIPVFDTQDAFTNVIFESRIDTQLCAGHSLRILHINPKPISSPEFEEEEEEEEGEEEPA